MKTCTRNKDSHRPWPFFPCLRDCHTNQNNSANKHSKFTEYDLTHPLRTFFGFSQGNQVKTTIWVVRLIFIKIFYFSIL